jgi:hypothetical protein
VERYRRLHRCSVDKEVIPSGLITAVAGWAVWTQPVRQSVTAFTKLLDAANRQDVAAARQLCSARYLSVKTPSE